MEDQIQLEHRIGFQGRGLRTLAVHPAKQNTLVYSIGGVIVLEDSQNEVGVSLNSQKYLRAHDNEVTCIDVSKNMIVSGQKGSRQSKYNESLVIQWDINSLEMRNIYRGLKEDVRNIMISKNEQFIAVTTNSQQLLIYLTDDQSIVLNKKYEQNVQLLCWSNSSKPNEIFLVTAIQNQIVINTIVYNIGTMQYQVKQEQCQLPASGLIRSYTCGQIDQNDENVYLGSSAGEICVFSMINRIFKAAIGVSTNWVLSIELVNESTLIVGSGDGKLKRLYKDSNFQLQNEVLLEGGITSINYLQSLNELLVGTNAGKIYRTNVSSLQSSIYSENSIGQLRDIKFSKDDNLFCIAGKDLDVWDMNNLSIVTKCQVNKKVEVMCVSFSDVEREVVGGYSDGFIRAFQYGMGQSVYQPKWEIVNAHKGNCSSLIVQSHYIISGGDDGVVRVWSRVNRQLISQLSNHTRTVSSILVDLNNPQIIHSSSVDKTIVSYDLKEEKKRIMHRTQNGMILDMSQRKDNENELITCGMNCPVEYWDIDMDQPVHQIQYYNRLTTLHTSPSGKYLILGDDLGAIHLFDLITNSKIIHSIGHSMHVTKVRWTHDHKQIISISQDNSISIWNFFE